MLMRLLERLVPGIYADPDRARKCEVCRTPVLPHERVPNTSGWYDTAECAAEGMARDAL